MNRPPASYDYSRREGIRYLAWSEVDSGVRVLAEAFRREGVEVVVGIVRGGAIVGGLVAASLRCGHEPVALSRREGDVVVRGRPRWRGGPADGLQGRRVGLVDDVADRGETLQMARERLESIGAGVTTAVLLGHSWAKPAPDVVALESDALVVFPWDRHVLDEKGRWVAHPEIEAAIETIETLEAGHRESE